QTDATGDLPRLAATHATTPPTQSRSATNAIARPGRESLRRSRSAARATFQNTRAVDGRLRMGEEEPLLRCEVWCPVEAVGAGEALVGAERVAHRIDEPVGASRREVVLPPDIEHFNAGSIPIDPRFDPADKAVAEGDREHVIAPT